MANFDNQPSSPVPDLCYSTTATGVQQPLLLRSREIGPIGRCRRSPVDVGTHLDFGIAELCHFSQHCAGLGVGQNVLCRLGGEEFLVILPGLTVEKTNPGLTVEKTKMELEAMMRSIPPLCSRLPAQVTIIYRFLWA